jgi:hypothetical protein
MVHHAGRHQRVRHLEQDGRVPAQQQHDLAVDLPDDAVCAALPERWRSPAHSTVYRSVITLPGQILPPARMTLRCHRGEYSATTPDQTRFSAVTIRLDDDNLTTVGKEIPTWLYQTARQG